jgi:hypothetical protein
MRKIVCTLLLCLAIPIRAPLFPTIDLILVRGQHVGFVIQQEVTVLLSVTVNMKVWTSLWRISPPASGFRYLELQNFLNQRPVAFFKVTPVIEL